MFKWSYFFSKFFLFFFVLIAMSSSNRTHWAEFQFKKKSKLQLEVHVSCKLWLTLSVPVQLLSLGPAVLLNLSSFHCIRKKTIGFFCFVFSWEILEEHQISTYAYVTIFFSLSTFLSGGCNLTKVAEIHLENENSL